MHQSQSLRTDSCWTAMQVYCLLQNETQQCLGWVWEKLVEPHSGRLCFSKCVYIKCAGGRKGRSSLICAPWEGSGKTQCWLSMGPLSFMFESCLCVFLQTLMSNPTYPKRNVEESFFTDFHQRHHLFPHYIPINTQCRLSTLHQW